MTVIFPPPAAQHAAPAIEILRDPTRFAAVEGAWRSLERRAGAGIFQSHDWISAWWEGGAARSGFQLNLALAWNGGELVGALPLALRSRYGLRVLEWAAKDFSDYCDALLSPSHQQMTIPLWHAVRRHGGFDVAYLSHLPPGGALARHGPEQLGLRPSHRSAAASGIRLGAWRTGEDFLESLSPRERKNYRRRRRVLAQDGPVRFRVLEEGELWSGLEQLRQMKLDWLGRTGFSSPLFEDDGTMLRSLATRLIARGSLRLFVLEAGDKTVAATLSIAAGTRLLDFVSAYDRDAHRGSPGTLALIDEVCWAIDNGCTEVDFLCGNEAYKHRFANTHAHLGALVDTTTPLGRAAFALDRCVPVVARLRDKIAFVSSSSKLSPGVPEA